MPYILVGHRIHIILSYHHEYKSWWASAQVWHIFTKFTFTFFVIHNCADIKLPLSCAVTLVFHAVTLVFHAVTLVFHAVIIFKPGACLVSYILPKYVHVCVYAPEAINN